MSAGQQRFHVNFYSLHQDVVAPGFSNYRRGDDVGVGRVKVLQTDQCEGSGIRSLLSKISAQLVRTFIFAVFSFESLW